MTFSCTEIIDALEQFAIAHRLSTIAEMDRIVVLDGGHIVEEGSHDMLLADRGRYWRYWTRQSGGFLGTEEAAE